MIFNIVLIIFVFILSIDYCYLMIQESLSMQFWDRDSFVDAPIRSLLYMFERDYPFPTAELIHLLLALCEGTWAAECVYVISTCSFLFFYLTTFVFLAVCAMSFSLLVSAPNSLLSS